MANYQIVMTAGPTPGVTYDLAAPDLTVGRDINADIVINIPEVSRRHARFRRDVGGIMLEDLGSTNGTFVNGQRLASPYLLKPGDTIMFGEAITLIFEAAEFDPNATVVSASSQAGTRISQDRMVSTPSKDSTMYAHDPIAAPQARMPQSTQEFPGPSAFSGQVPAGPTDFGEEIPVEEPKSRTWLWAGLGCLVVLLCGCVAGAILFDMMNMYCQAPFDTLFSFLYPCP